MAVYEHYTKELWAEFAYLGTWLPNTKISLGDVGEIVDGKFEHRSSLQTLGLAFEQELAGTPMTLVHRSEGVSAVQVAADGSAPIAASFTDASVKVNLCFKNEHSLLFAASECSPYRIKDVSLLEMPLRDLHAIGAWKTSYLVVTEVLEAKTATILVASTAGAEIELHGKGGIGAYNLAKLADAGAGLSITSSHGLATEIVAERGLTPLFKGMWLGWRLFQGRVLTTARRGEGASVEVTPPDALVEVDPEGVATR